MDVIMSGWPRYTVIDGLCWSISYGHMALEFNWSSSSSLTFRFLFLLISLPQRSTFHLQLLPHTANSHLLDHLYLQNNLHILNIRQNHRSSPYLVVRNILEAEQWTEGNPTTSGEQGRSAFGPKPLCSLWMLTSNVLSLIACSCWVRHQILRNPSIGFLETIWEALDYLKLVTCAENVGCWYS